MTQEEQKALLAAAREAIEYGLAHGRPAPAPAASSASLMEPGASFVTLLQRGALRGCIGSLEASKPLIEDVAANAWAAAFRDPRFPPLSSTEWALTDLGISVLTPREPLPRQDRRTLLASLRPGIDGLVIASSDGRQATFLPSVWDQLPEPDDFLDHLLAKAGLPADQDIRQLRTWRYQTRSFSADHAD